MENNLDAVRFTITVRNKNTLSDFDRRRRKGFFDPADSNIFFSKDFGL